MASKKKLQLTREQTCRKYVENFQRAMGLEDWTIDILFERLEGNTMAESYFMPEYRRATMTFDLSEHTEEDESLLESIRHEFLHIIHSPLGLYRDSVATLVSNPSWAVLEKVWGHSCEEMVSRMETILDNLGLTPEKIEREGRIYG